MANDPMEFFDAMVIHCAQGKKRFGDVMAPFQRERFEQIVPALLAVANGTKPPIGRYWWEAVKGAAKDSDLAACLLWLTAFTRRPLQIQLGAADQDQADETRKAAKVILPLWPWLAQRVQIQNWKIICEATDSVCEIVAADIAGSHGSRPDVLVINELSHIERREFAENLRDNAAKVPHGLVVIATNAGYLGTWQHDWREIARTSDRWIFNQRTEPAPWLDPAEIEEAKQRNTAARFNRLFRGVWAPAGSGNAIDADDLDKAVCLPGPLTKYDGRFGPYLMGIDLGIRRDHSAACIIGLNLRGDRMRLAHCRSWDPAKWCGSIPLSVVRDECLGLARDFQIIGCAFDPWNAHLLAEQMAAENIPMYPHVSSAKERDLVAKHTIEIFRNRLVDLYHDEGLLRDLSRVSLVERNGKYTIVMPRDESGHCDKASAFLISTIWSANTRKFLGGQMPPDFTEQVCA